MILITAVLATIVLLTAAAWSRNVAGPSGRREIARRSDWTDEQHRQATQECRRDRENLHTRIQIALWALLVALAVWMAIQLGL